MDLPTRERLLEYLSTHPDLSALELSRALQVTVAGIRYHLKDLLFAGLVIAAPDRRPKKRNHPGRPTSVVYRLSPQGLPDNQLALLSAALRLLFHQDAGPVPGQNLRRLADNLSPAPTTDHAGLVQRLNRLVQHFNQAGHRAHWEARATGPCMVFHNCPYQAVLAQFPELCQVDHQIIASYTQAGTEIVATINPNSTHGGSKRCLFAIKA